MRAPTIGLLAAAVLALSLPMALAAPATPSPHGHPDRCAACHVPDQGPPTTATCRTCHPTADMHVVDVMPRKVKVPDSFPLQAGRITCSTCHAETAHAEVADDLPAPWHRGGPYTSTAAFCQACHQDTSLQRVDPHHPSPVLGADDGSCSACHTSHPTPGAAPDQANLRLDPAATCLTCHPAAPHAGAAEHLGRPLPPGVSLPGVDGTITCFTCHDVHGGHAAGRVQSPASDALRERALSSEWKALTGATLPGAPRAHMPMLARPLEGDALCATCHGESR